MKKIIILVIIVLIIGFFWFKKGGAPAEDLASVPSPVGEGVITTPPAPTENIKEFTIIGSNYAFTPKTMEVNKGDTVRITLQSTVGFHDFKLDEFAGAATKQLKAGESETIEFVADKVGDFEYYCSVGNHRAMGMKGTLTVK